MKNFIIQMFSDGNNSISFMRFLCLLSFIQSCVLCYAGLFYSKEGISVELSSVIFTYVAGAFLGKHFSKLAEIKKSIKETQKSQILNEG